HGWSRQPPRYAALLRFCHPVSGIARDGDPNLIDTRGQMHSVGDLRSLRSLSCIAHTLEHESVVLVDKGTVVYLNAAQSDWMIQEYLAKDSPAESQNPPAAERAEFTAQAWRSAREWYTCAELQQMVASQALN
ncbi:MAG: hypothetical protein OEU36_22965, partial [Gammaproteobacteria bacterium]|nr:hypothetical protein [Gammaproteobacteria bacterium]